ncbi:MAG: Nif3-like dinuclear metal center hexameric protein [Firmicutes bacterium]|nr:Nif3-like dinuclear metal center hexameric protein [Bacillota bacterium]
MEVWDNTGIQISAGSEEVSRVLVCLDVCDETVDEAVEKNCDFIVSHHPMFFEGIKSITEDNAKGRQIIKLITNGISVYSSHTSFDTVQGGNNDYLANIIGLNSVTAPEEEPIMRVGRLEKPAAMRDLCDLVNREIMKGKGLSYAGELDSIVHTVGICTGAGASLMSAACRSGCDVLITGDVKYHDYQRADELGIKIIDAGHYETEILFTENMGEKLKALLGDKVEIIPCPMQKNSLKRYDCMV